MMIQAKLIARNSHAELVETVKDKITYRTSVPSGSVQNGLIDEEILSMGIPYGLPIARYFDFSITPQILENALHNHGLWTAQDILTNSDATYSALRDALGLDLAAIFTIARQHKND